MTSTVIVKAHCSDDKEVIVTRDEGDGKISETYLNNCEEYQGHVYDDVVIRVREVLK